MVLKSRTVSVFRCSKVRGSCWRLATVARYACQPLLVDSSCCSLLEEVYDYGSGCLCCTPGGELNQRLNSMIAWGIPAATG